MSQDSVIQIVSMLFAAGAIYGAIRNDIKNIHEKISEVSASAKDAHDRINDLLLQRRTGDK